MLRDLISCLSNPENKTGILSALTLLSHLFHFEGLKAVLVQAIVSHSFNFYAFAITDAIGTLCLLVYTQQTHGVKAGKHTDVEPHLSVPQSLCKISGLLLSFTPGEAANLKYSHICASLVSLPGWISISGAEGVGVLIAKLWAENRIHFNDILFFFSFWRIKLLLRDWEIGDGNLNIKQKLFSSCSPHHKQ